MLVSRINKFLSEVYEPGQEIFDTKKFTDIFVGVDNKKDYDFFVKWLYDRNFVWDSYGLIEYINEPWEKYGENLVLRLHSIKNGRGKVNQFTYTGYSDNMSYDFKPNENYFKMKKFIEVAEHDDRIVK